MARKDPYIGARFSLSIGNITQALFNEVTIPDMSTDAVEFRAGNYKGLHTRKQPGLVKFGNVVLKSGLTDSKELHDWFKNAVVNGKVKKERKNFAVALLDEDDKEVSRWEFEEGWPLKYDAPDLKGQEAAIAIESVEIAIEGMERTK